MYANKKRKRIVMSLLILMVLMTGLFAGPVSVYADTYVYDLWDKAIPAPEAYAWSKSIRAEQLEIDSMDNISDIFYQNGKVYIAMTGKVVVANEDFETQFVITDYTDAEWNKTSVSNPQCVFVTKDDQIYITEQDLGMIVQFDELGSYVRTLKDPGITGLDVKYAPTKVVVDDYGRIYVKAKNVYEGIIELDPDGAYNCFVGANEVKPSVWERFLRTIATEEQISRMALWLPTSYSDISLDKDGYLLASVNEALSSEPIRRLNADGADILGTYTYLQRPMGDYTGNMSNSSITTISAAADGRFGVIDSTMSRVFVYSEDGLMAYELGSSGKTNGSLSSPVDITFMDDKILIADLVAKSIEVYTPTEYGMLINEALKYQSDYDYETAAEYWSRAYDIYPNSILVNMGIGKQKLREGKFEEAINYFKASGDVENYSAAYERVRENTLEQYLGMTLILLVIVVILLILLRKFIRRKSAAGAFEKSRAVGILRKIRYQAFTWPGYVLASPFKAFDDIKYENAGSTVFGVIVLFLYAWSSLFKTKYCGFIVNGVNTAEINVPLVLVSSVFPILIFIAGNWAVGTLIEGKGDMKSIFKLNMYALYPAIYFNVIGTLFSRVIILEEATLVTFLFAFPMVIYVFYCFIGILMVHQFTLTKGVASVLLSFVAMAIIIFILALLLTLVSSFVNDWGTILDEIVQYLL